MCRNCQVASVQPWSRQVARSLKQVETNTESTHRQYGLRRSAIALGWREGRIRVIDDDQGKSGAGVGAARSRRAADRDGDHFHGDGQAPAQLVSRGSRWNGTRGKLYDRPADTITVDEIERIVI